MLLSRIFPQKKLPFLVNFADKNRLDVKVSRLCIRQSNQKRAIKTRSHLSR